jgi:hypothetical protein
MPHVLLTLSTYNLPPSFFSLLPTSNPTYHKQQWALLSLLVALFTTAIILDQTCDATCWSESFWGPVNFIEKALDPDDGYCESARGDAFLIERVNALSNFCFIAMGFVFISCGLHDVRVNFGNESAEHTTSTASAATTSATTSTAAYVRPLLLHHPIHSFYLGLGIAYAGVGSFIFHGSLTELGHTLDMASVYVMLGFFALYALSCLLSVLVGNNLAVTVPALVIVAWFSFYYQFTFLHSTSDIGATTLIPAFVVVLIFVMTLRDGVFRRASPSSLPHRDNSTFVLPVFSVFSALTAFLLWNVDTLRWSCHPHSGLYGHSAWHCLMALSLAGVYFFFRAEGGASNVTEIKSERVEPKRDEVNNLL